MGCFSSKAATNVEQDGGSVTLNKKEDPKSTESEEEGAPMTAPWIPASKKPPTMEEARQTQADRGPRLSVKYQTKEMTPSGRVTTSRRSSLPFDRSRIGTHTRHGLMPGPRGHSAAKINQDRGVVCWPFNGRARAAAG